MGFTERVRRQKAEEEARRLAKAERKDGESRDQQTRKNRTRERFEQDRRAAVAHFQASDFPRLLKELTFVVKDMSVECISSVEDPLFYYIANSWDLDEDALLKTKGRFTATIRWGERVVPAGHNRIKITTDSEGTIQVKGRVVTTLPLNKWRGRADVQESALEEAYHNPEKVPYSQYSEMDIASAGGYGMS